jgi:predicted secreted protein
MTRTNTIQKSRTTMDTTEHKKKLRWRMEIKGKMKNTKVKKIWLKVSRNKGSKRPKDSRKGKESRKWREGREHQGQMKEKEKRRQVTR